MYFITNVIEQINIVLTKLIIRDDKIAAAVAAELLQSLKIRISN